MESKRWYTSKLVWMGVVECSISILQGLSEFLATGDLSPAAVVGFVAGVMTIVLRFMTTQAVE